MASLNGTLEGGHIVTASLTWQDRKNISDDFSPAANDYPSDPADIEGEWGRGRSDERWRAVVSGIFRLPWSVTVAPVYEYGSGQPWTRRLGYDYNGDRRFSDRAAGVTRNDENGPDFNSFSMRITKGFAIGGAGRLDLIVEGFNILNDTNYDVNFVDSAQYLSGPTVTNPTAAYVANPNFGNYSATLSAARDPARSALLVLGRSRQERRRFQPCIRIRGAARPPETGTRTGGQSMALETGLQGKVVIVTGAAAGIGRATALAFAGQGCTVAAWDVNDAGADALVAELASAGGNGAFFKVNVADGDAVRAAVDAVVTRFGRVDVMVNNAGIVRDAQLVKWKDGAVVSTLSDEAWDAVIDVNLKGVFLCTRAVAPHMIAQGSGVILSTSSVVGLYGNFGQTNYVATKAGVIGMTRTWARELGRYGIRVNAVAPGFIATEILTSMPPKVHRVDGRAHASRPHGQARGHRQRLRLARLRRCLVRHRHGALGGRWVGRRDVKQSSQVRGTSPPFKRSP